VLAREVARFQMKSARMLSSVFVLHFCVNSFLGVMNIVSTTFFSFFMEFRIFYIFLVNDVMYKAGLF
jgi:capsule polysaccharide modification protein KpsS